MHFVFIPYGKRSEVETLLRDMEAQKHKIIIEKDGEQREVWIQAQIRQLPLGAYEYVFPKQDLDKVINTLCKERDRYDLGKMKLLFLRKLYRSKKIPEETTDKGQYLWYKEFVNIIPIGIREDSDIVDRGGWKHEAI